MYIILYNYPDIKNAGLLCLYTEEQKEKLGPKIYCLSLTAHQYYTKHYDPELLDCFPRKQKCSSLFVP